MKTRRESPALTSRRRKGEDYIVVCRRGKEHAESGNISSFQLACPRNHSFLGLARYILYRIRYNTFRIRTSNYDKVDTTPKAELPLVRASKNVQPYAVLSNFQQSQSRSTRQLSLQIELISHMHIWRQSVSGPGSKFRTCHITIHCDCFMAGTTVEAYFYSLLWTWFLCPV